jgi:hypothetical protein
MNRRRSLLAGGKKPPMYVYEPGYTSFKNTDGYGGTGATVSCYFSKNGYVEIYGNYQENYETYNISFTEARYKGYKKLIIKAKANVSNCKISWGSTSIYVGYSTQEFVIDISNDTGSRNINFQTYGEQTFTVYDIHFE